MTDLQLSLASMVPPVMKGDAPLHVTLMVRGLLVTGEIVTHETYAEGDPLGKLMSEVLADLPKRLEVPEEQVEASGHHRFIHLRNAQFIAPGAARLPSNKGSYCRIALESVDGHMFGEMRTAA